MVLDESVFVISNTAGSYVSGTLAVTTKAPVIKFAVRLGAVAMPSEFVSSTTVVTSPLKVALACPLRPLSRPV